jgi:Rod binding domain-containing protein
MEKATMINGPVNVRGTSGYLGGATPGNLREASQEFESLFIARMVDAMRSTVPQSNLMGNSSGQRIFRQMLDQELSKQVARSGGFGLGEMLYQQLNCEPEDHAPELPGD